MAFAGHLWTLSGYLQRTLRPPQAPPSRQWTTILTDPDLGPIRLSGKLSEPTGAEALVVLVHGLGGSCESPYVIEAAAHLERSNLACLRLNLRGADGTGEDIYHGGLTADLIAAFSSLEVAAYDRVALLGFSLGGHVSLRFAVDDPPAELRAVVTICPPVDLAVAATTIDSAGKWVYRRYLLSRLVHLYSRVARRRHLATSVEDVGRAKTFVEFDSLVIAPRYGFADAWDYYQKVSVGGELRNLGVPTLLVAAEGDPMVPAASLRAHIGPSTGNLECHWSKRGGHLGFPGDLDLGCAAELGLYSQVRSWLQARLLV